MDAVCIQMIHLVRVMGWDQLMIAVIDILSYNPLLKKLIDLKMTRTSLAVKVGFSRTTLAKIGKDEPISIDVILRICDELDCDIVDVISYLPEGKPAEN